MSSSCCPSTWDEYEVYMKYEPRLAVPFVGPLGWVAFGLEAICGIWFFVMLIGKAQNNPYIILGLLIGLSGFEVAFWIFNALRYAPYTQLHETTRMLIEKKHDTVWAVKAMRSLQHSNDQGHFQGTIFRSLLVLLFFGIFIGFYGTNTYDTLPPVYNAAASDLHSRALDILVLALLAVSGSYYLYLTETHSDYIWRQFSSFHDDNEAGVEFSVAKKINTGLNKPAPKSILSSMKTK